jgi:ABC-type transporter Mla subunit MlaD
MQRRLAAVAALLLGAAALLVVLRGGEEERVAYVTVPDATGLVDGLHIRSGGTPVGKVADISAVDRGRAARLKLTFDEEVWPLPEGTRLTVRWGGTVNLFNRYVELRLGEKGGEPMVEDGGELPQSAFRVPVEYGDLVNVFDRELRRDLKRLLDRGGLALGDAAPSLNKALGVAPGAVREGSAVLAQLDRAGARLETLVRTTDRVVDAVQRATPGVSELVVTAAQTLDALAADVGSLQGTLRRAPATLRRATRTLANADATLTVAKEVTDRLAPGAKELRKTTAPLNTLLSRLLQVAPSAKATLATAADSAPDVTQLLQRAHGLAPQLVSITGQADIALNCIRPYTPEIVSLGTLWASALSGVDGEGKYIRAIPTVSPAFAGNVMPVSSGDIAKLFPGLEYAFPRPPGTQAGQPWFIPECGAGPDAFDPSKDPEARPFAQSLLPPELRPAKKEDER